ncbi:MAG: hypothetical protein A3C27_00995 [Candidatus Levybacteria bacterium RIFCSPHIGHO2_02_FULL_39_36]|nr:MAG: hypothetical protein UT20_C0051G0012 [Candidatus Levybacteria bacterium GW2011_GWA1_39_11]KKR25105.1 MAG: hypothetical protein UT56_C0003G0029 [Candidatus Levybacteria bacterium GW2011_GWB1_39_7]KKR26092.1 MAG: hypothetical protein UT57_C0043G0011 [Microgenomates group bacterium GW2011_GWC1_39_7]OGH15523.1 MAG: hypothetical protein A2689_03015 [Candidatus Levybacteria bacterium RIFCSPHIGHO2_01_FULL_38_96]OGH28391.1 MAG: hypothetical protein A3C27_00995 [Candidatus Levybacteria bacterium
MAERRVIFIIPGFRQHPKNKAYQEISKILESEDYFPILVKIEWKKSTVSENTEYFLKLYKKIKARKKYILGFSYGAMIAFVASTKVRTSGLILCSLSPYFKEDLSNKKKESFSALMSYRYEDFTKLNSSNLAKNIKAKKILMLYGSQEARSLIKRVKETFEQIDSKQKHLVSIRKTEHEIGNKRYIESIHLAAKNFL